MAKTKTTTRSRPSSSTDRTTDYAKRVVAGKVVAGSHVRASCQRHLNNLKDGQARGIYFDQAAAERAHTFFETVLKLNGGQFEGKPFRLHESQAFIIGSLFGWMREDGTRRFRRAYIEQGKGNGKSPLVGGIGIYGMIADNEPRAEIYAAASKRDQAMVLFRDARAMVQLSPSLKKVCEVSGGDHSPNIAYLQKGSFFRPISSDKGQSGPRPHMALCDEVHEHPNRDTMEMLERGFKFRRNPLLVMITNSGFDKTTVCWEEHEHAVRVAHGEIEDDSTFSYVCALDEGDDPLEDPSCWAKVNPLLGVTISESYLAGVVLQAKAMPGKRNGILRLHFCIWTDAAAAAITREMWEPCQFDLDLEKYRGRDCYLGLDMSYSKDLTALALVFPNPDGTRDAFVEFWTPGDTMREREAKDKVNYAVWAEQGYINAPQGKIVKLEAVASRLGTLLDLANVITVAYDRYRHKEMEDDLSELGIEPPMVEHPQGMRRVKDSELWMPGSWELLEDALTEGTIRITKNPVLTWNAASTVTKDDPAGTGNRVPDKRRATGRIDGIVALAMAMGASERHKPEAPSVYETRGIRTV